MPPVFFCVQAPAAHALAATVCGLHCYDAPPADPLFTDLLLEDFMQATTHPDPLAFHLTPALPWVRARHVASGSMAHLDTSWALMQLTTAVLLLLTSVASVLTPGQPGRQQPAPAVLPAVSATPATPESAGVATHLLLDLVIPTLSDDEAWVQIDRYTFPPATTMEADVRRGRVPEVFFVVDGALDVRVIDAPQPVRVIRAGGVEPEEAITSGESTVLAAGDGVVLPGRGAADLRNQAAEPAVLLLLLMPNYLPAPRGRGDPAVVYEPLAGSNWQVRAPLTLTLKQVTLAPDAALPGADAPNVRQVFSPIDPERVLDARITTDGGLRNAGDEPLAAYVVTAMSGSPE